MPEKTQKSNTEKNTDTEKTQELTSQYPDIVMEGIMITENRIEGLFELMHKLIENPYKLKDIDKLLEFSIKFKNKIELPYFISNIIFEDSVKVTGLELKGSVVYFTYEVNNIDNYKYYIDFGASKLVAKEYILFRYVLENLNDDDLSNIRNTLSDIIVKVDNERNMVLKLLKDGNVKIEN